LLKVPVPEDTKYFILKVLDPAVNPVMRKVDPALIRVFGAFPTATAREDVAATVVAPDTSKEASTSPAPDWYKKTEMLTNAFVPVVNVTEGPGVAKSA